MLKKYLLILFWFFNICFIVSCDKAENISGPEPSNENILRFDVPAPLTPVNPAAINFTGSSVIFPLLYSYLCVPDENGQLKPDLAESWTYDPETFSWTIHLRTDAFFHNGRPVTSQDVKNSFFLVLKNTNAALMDTVKEIILANSSKLCVYLKKNDPDFMKKIWVMEILPQFDDGTVQEMDVLVGSGPFQFRSRVGNAQVVLSANKNYYLGPPLLDGVVYYYQPDKEKSWTRLLSGKTDIAFAISPKNYEIMKQYDNRFYFDHYTLGHYAILLYNTHDPLFSNPQVRQALTHAIDRDYIVKHMLKGYGKVAAGPMGIESPYHNPNVRPFSYDPEKSLALLQQAGWFLNKNDRYLYKDKKRFEFTLLLPKEFQVERKIAQYIKLCLNEIGIKMTIQYLLHEACYQKYKRNTDFQAVLTEFTDGCRLPEFLKQLWTPIFLGKSRAGCFAHPEVTKLIDQAFSEKDPVQKKIYLLKADALISSLQPGTFLFHKIAVDVMSRRFSLPSSLSLTNQGLYRLKDASLAQN